MPSFRRPEPFAQMSKAEDLNECKGCGRTFNDEAFAKHARICKKVFQTKRKVFNSQAKRLVSQEQKKLVLQAKKPKPAATQAQGQPKWKNQSEQFRMAMRAARGASAFPGASTKY